MNSSGRIAVGLSGGVDSAVTAAILQRQGFEVLGLTMKIWSGTFRFPEGAKQACYGPDEAEDIEACERLCARLGIAYHVLDLCAEYEARVLDYFRSEYLRGRTPNPCIVCNRELKFGFLTDRARASGLDFSAFATGHYARIVERDGFRYIARARHVEKDQSYFLYGLSSGRLADIRFPLGDSTKEEVRAIARSLDLEVADKPESQDFVAGGDYSVLFQGREPEPGDIVTPDGSIVGRHRGLPYYTVGQRRGLGISLGTDPVYVLALDAARNRIIVGPGAGLFASGLTCGEFRLQNPEDASRLQSVGVRIRQNHGPVPCSLRLTAGASEGREIQADVQDGQYFRAQIDFETPQRAVAPGQSAVLYAEDGRVLGGGQIDEAVAD